VSAVDVRAAHVRPRVRALSLSADRVAVLALAALAVVLTAVTWNRWGDLGLDTGYDLVAGAKVSHLDAPYLDYVYFYGPLGPFLLGAVFEVLGIGVGQSVVLGLALAAAGIGLAYALARQLVGPLAAACVGALAAVPALSNSNVSYVQPHTLAAPVGMVVGLATVLALLRFARGGGRGWLAVTGAGVGLAALTRPESFGAVALAVGGWLLVRLLRTPAPRRAAWRDAAATVLPAAGVALAGYGAFFLVGAFHNGLTLHELLRENLFPAGQIRESVSVVYAQLAPMTATSFAALGAKLVLYGAGMAAMVAVARALHRPGPWRIAAIALLGLGVVAFLGVLAGRPDTVRYYLRFAFAWLPAGSAIAAAALAWRAVRGREWGVAAQLELLVALLLVGFSYSAYALYVPYPNPAFPQETAYAMPVIATFLAWLHVRVLPASGLAPARTLRAVGAGWIALLAVACVALLVHDARRETFMVHGPRGTIAATPAEGPAFQGAIDAIERHTRPTEPILLAPQMSALYVMTGRTDLLPELSLLPGSLDGPAAQRAAIRTMDERNLRLAITDRAPLTRYGKGPFGVGYDGLIGAWLRRDFIHLTTLRGTAGGGDQRRALDVWLRRTQ
jgi:hypothetical protein